MRSSERPSASASVKPKMRSAAGFHRTMAPAASHTMMASPAPSTSCLKSTEACMLASRLDASEIPRPPALRGLEKPRGNAWLRLPSLRAARRSISTVPYSGFGRMSQCKSLIDLMTPHASHLDRYSVSSCQEFVNGARGPVGNGFGQYVRVESNPVSLPSMKGLDAESAIKCGTYLAS